MKTPAPRLDGPVESLLVLDVLFLAGVLVLAGLTALTARAAFKR